MGTSISPCLVGSVTQCNGSSSCLANDMGGTYTLVASDAVVRWCRLTLSNPC